MQDFADHKISIYLFLLYPDFLQEVKMIYKGETPPIFSQQLRDHGPIPSLIFHTCGLIWILFKILNFQLNSLITKSQYFSFSFEFLTENKFANDIIWYFMVRPF